MDKLAERLGVALLIILAIGAISWAGKVDQELEEDNDTHYCEMVKLFKETKGESGWPPYKGECEWTL